MVQQHFGNISCCWCIQKCDKPMSTPENIVTGGRLGSGVESKERYCRILCCLHHSAYNRALSHILAKKEPLSWSMLLFPLSYHISSKALGTTEINDTSTKIWGGRRINPSIIVLAWVIDWRARRKRKTEFSARESITPNVNKHHHFIIWRYVGDKMPISSSIIIIKSKRR